MDKNALLKIEASRLGLHISPDALSLQDELRDKVGVLPWELNVALNRALLEESAAGRACFGVRALMRVYHALVVEQIGPVDMHRAGRGALRFLVTEHRRRCARQLVSATVQHWDDLTQATFERYLAAVQSERDPDFVERVHDSALPPIGGLRRGALEEEIARQIVSAEGRIGSRCANDVRQHPRMLHMIEQHLTRLIDVPIFMIGTPHERRSDGQRSLTALFTSRLHARGYCDACIDEALRLAAEPGVFSQHYVAKV